MESNVSTRRCAFSLIELLIVISILALLMAILVPALRNARKQAKMTVCGVHLHQLGLATELYMLENQCYPPHKWRMPNGEMNRWPSAVAEFIRSEDLLVCPAVSQWAVGRNNAYGYNYKYLGSLRSNDQSPAAPYEMFPVRGVKSPSGTIAYADSDGTGFKQPYESDGKDVDALGNHGYTLDPTFVPPYARYTINNEGEQEEYAYHEYRSYISTRHQGAANAVFVDGHASRITPRQVYVDNRFWNGLGVEDPSRDPHVDYRVGTGTFRFADAIRGAN